MTGSLVNMKRLPKGPAERSLEAEGRGTLWLELGGCVNQGVEKEMRGVMGNGCRTTSNLNRGC